VHVQLSNFEPTPLHRESEPGPVAHASSEERRKTSGRIPPAFMQSQNKAITTWWGFQKYPSDDVSGGFLMKIFLSMMKIMPENPVS
jgi:hypothetical protein